LIAHSPSSYQQRVCNLAQYGLDEGVFGQVVDGRGQVGLGRGNGNINVVAAPSSRGRRPL